MHGTAIRSETPTDALANMGSHWGPWTGPGPRSGCNLQLHWNCSVVTREQLIDDDYTVRALTLCDLVYYYGFTAPVLLQSSNLFEV